MTRSTSLIAALLLVSLPAAVEAQQPSVPPELQPWRGWVLDGKEHLSCPFWVAGAHGSADRHPCAVRRLRRR